MAPIFQSAPESASRPKHSLFRRDMNNGSVVSVIIAVVILSILVSGISIFLFRQLWAKMRRSQLGRHPSPNTSNRISDLEPCFGASKQTRSLPTYRQSTRVRSNSDDLWSAQLDHKTSEDDGTDFRPFARRQAGKPNRFWSISFISSSSFRPSELHSLEEHGPKQSSLEERPREEQGVRSRATFEPQSTPTKTLPLRSHPVNLATLHRCSSSFDASQNRAGRRKSLGRADAKEFV